MIWLLGARPYQQTANSFGFGHRQKDSEDGENGEKKEEENCWYSFFFGCVQSRSFLLLRIKPYHRRTARQRRGGRKKKPSFIKPEQILERLTRPACEASKGSQWKRRGFSPLLATPVSNDKLNVSSHWGHIVKIRRIWNDIFNSAHINISFQIYGILTHIEESESSFKYSQVSGLAKHKHKIVWMVPVGSFSAYRRQMQCCSRRGEDEDDYYFPLHGSSAYN